MTQPTPYTRQYNFTGFSASQPSNQQPGVSMDAEFNAIRFTADAILASLKVIQRDDGGLTNGSVGLDQISATALVVLSTSWLPRGAWLTATAYHVSDVVSITGATYVCAVAHTSTVFANNLASNYWTTIYSTAGVTPGDGTVTTAKIADGAVTAAKLGFTAIDIAGTMRAAGGLSAGTAALGSYALAGAGMVGAIYASLARNTQAQGNVGVRLDGGIDGKVWELRQSTSTNTLIFQNNTLGVPSFGLYETGLSDHNFTFRVTGGGTPVGGSGMELSASAGASVIRAYDRANALEKSLSLVGTPVTIGSSGVTVLTITNAGAAFTAATVGGSAVGYLDTPINLQNINYTLVLADRGKMVRTTGAAAYAYTIPPQASVAWPIGTTIVFRNINSSPLAIVRGAGVSLRLGGSGTSKDMSMGQWGMATVIMEENDVWVIVGNGVT